MRLPLYVPQASNDLLGSGFAPFGGANVPTESDEREVLSAIAWVVGVHGVVPELRGVDLRRAPVECGGAFRHGGANSTVLS